MEEKQNSVVLFFSWCFSGRMWTPRNSKERPEKLPKKIIFKLEHIFGETNLFLLFFM